MKLTTARNARTHTGETFEDENAVRRHAAAYDRALPASRAAEVANPARRAMLRNGGAQRLARALGWFSIGLGLAELLAPRAVGRLAGGTGAHAGLTRLYGLREIASGLIIFSQGRKPVSGMWSRVGGDAIDLATLGALAVSPKANRAGLAFAAANVLAVTALDVVCAKELTRQAGTLTDDGAVRVTKSIAINRPPAHVYQFWHDVQNFPRFMYHVQSVEEIGDGRTHWVTKGPRGRSIEWDSEITADEPNALIAWRSLKGADLDNSGSVAFEARPGGRGTIVRVVFEYRPPGGLAGAALAKMLGGSPEQKIDDDLRRLKQIIETGEVIRSDGSPEGTGRLAQRPAQPSGKS